MHDSAISSTRPPRESGAAQTLSGAVLETLRRDILECRWAPGAKLRFEALRERYAVGLSPLREALSRLAVEGLVVGIDRRGFRVAPVSLADLDEITELRCELEAMALRWSIERGDDVWEGAVVAAAHHLGRIHWDVGSRPAQISAEWEQRHGAFHKALTAACGSARLMQLRAQFFDQTNRYRRLAVAFSKVARDDRGEHRTLTEVALARDTAKAEALIRLHIRRTAADVRAIYAEGAEEFAGAVPARGARSESVSRGR